VLDAGHGTPRGRGDLRVEPSAKTCNCKLQPNSSDLCCHLANTNEKLGGRATTIPLFAKFALVYYQTLYMYFCVVLISRFCSVESSQHFNLAFFPGVLFLYKIQSDLSHNVNRIVHYCIHCSVHACSFTYLVGML